MKRTEPRVNRLSANSGNVMGELPVLGSVILNHELHTPSESRILLLCLYSPVSVTLLGLSVRFYKTYYNLALS